MSGSSNSVCRQCGATLRADESLCSRCLLAVVSADDSGSPEERIFQQALALESKARQEFIREVTRESSSLQSAVLLLLEGYEEAGGDAAQATHGDSPSARAQWAIVRNEEPGTVIDHFRLVRLLGEGGMGSVWRAEQMTPVQRTVALKVIKLGMDTREVVRRFERERQTLALLNHPNIAQVFEAGATALGRPYFAMELVEGQPITVYCESAGLDLKARLKLFQEVCAAVEHAHQKGVIHRDIKPSNIMVANGAVKVIDFGVAKATQGAADTFFTQPAKIVGTPAYMSPEQARTGGVDVDTRTDVYALGVVLYELLTGTLPIDSDRLVNTSVAEMQRILLEEDPPTPSTRLTLQLKFGVPPSGGKAASVSERGRLSISGPPPKGGTPNEAARSPYAMTKLIHLLHGDLDRVVMKAIRKDRNERYASAAALSEDLCRYLAGETVSAVPPTLAYQFGKFVRRNRIAVAAGAAVILALLAGLIVSLIQVTRANKALAGETKARDETTFTLADMYARSGLAVAEGGEPTRAALWFANAAILSAKDVERVAVNGSRAAAWRQETITAVRAFDTGFERLSHLSWNPRYPAMIASAENNVSVQVWNLETEQQWPPAVELQLRGAAWDPSGDRLAVLGSEGTLAVLEFPSGKEIVRTSHVGAADLEWSPDGQWLAGGDVLWDWRKNERLQLPQSVWRIRFSRDGRFVLLHWGTQTGICALDAPGRFLHPSVPARLRDRSDFLGDGGSYVVGAPDSGLRIHDSITGAILESHTERMPGRDVGSPIATSPDGRFIARQSMTVLDRQNPGATKFPTHRGLFTEARFSPDGSLLASGGYDNRMELWSMDGRFFREVGHHHTAVISLEFSPDGRFVASDENGLVRVWRIRRPELVRRIPASGSTLAALSRDGKFVAASGFSNRSGNVKQTRVFDIATGQPIGPEIVPGGLIMDAFFNPDSDWLALAVSTTTDRSDAAFEKTGGLGNIQFWNHRTGERLGDPISMPSEPRGICLHPSGRWIGVCCAGGEGVEIEVASRTARVLFHHDKPTHAGATLNNGRCAYSPDGRVFAVWGLYQFIHLWDRAQSRELLEPFERVSNTFDLAFHGDIVARAIVASKMQIEFHNLRTGAEAAPAIPFINWPFLTRFSADGNLLLTAGGGRTAQVWDWRQGKLVCPMLPHAETIMAGCFVPGTPWVITGGHDGKIKFWDHRTGMMIRPPLQRDGWVLDLQLTPDGRTLIASGWLKGDIELVDLRAALPAPDLDPDAARLLSEIDADAEVHPGGGLARLPPEAWPKKWQEFRKRYPDYAGHRLAE